MQASDRVLAWRYGRALFLAASAKGEESRVQSDLQASYRTILGSSAVLRNPRVPTADKKKKLHELLGTKVVPLTTRFLELLVDKKRFDLLPMVTADLGRLIAEKNNTAKAQVRAARPLSAQEQAKLKDSLKNFAGKNIELEIKEDPEIIGGVVVRLGDWVFDSSLRGQLKALSRRLNSESAA